MARLFPTNFDLQQLEMSEQRVVKSLLDQLDESWTVTPKVLVTWKGRDSEIDIVLTSFDQGIMLVEVKGGRITLHEGQWFQYDRPMKDPVEQVMAAKHALIRRLIKMGVKLKGVHVDHCVAFPDLQDFPDTGGGPHCPREKVLTSRELSSGRALTAVLSDHGRSVSKKTMTTILKSLRADVSEIDVSGRHVRGNTQRIMAVTSDRLGPVIGLDENLRIYLRGGAGTGKTFVAGKWVRRALVRGESTMYVCYNRLLGAEMVERLETMHSELEEPPSLIAGNFHQLIRRLLGDHAPDVPTHADQQWWDEELPRYFLSAIDMMSQRFDTIIVDEAQDFRPLWFELLERLMTNADTGRFYVLADTKQEIYGSGWVPPSGVTRLELTHNVRNSSRIGQAVCNLGGAPVARGTAPGPEIQVHAVGGAREMVKAVRKSLQFALDELDIPASQLMVLTTHREVRDELISVLNEDLHVSRWDDRGEGDIACETVHRTKGLERVGVVLVNMDDPPDATLAYIGASRASGFLAVVGRDSLASLFIGTTAP